MANLLARLFPYKNIGWKDIGEDFIRYQLLKTRWLNIYLHELEAPNWHPDAHDHPWSFITLILWRGYVERVEGKLYRRRPGSILYRPAKFAHNVITPYGRSWSLIFTTAKKREWIFVPDRGVSSAAKLSVSKTELGGSNPSAPANV